MPRTRTWNNSRFHDVVWQRMFDNIAEDVQWYKGTFCSCAQDGDPNRAKATCKVCGGWGVLYPDPAVWLRVGVTGISREKKLVEEGFVFAGDLILVLPPRLDSIPTDWDKIVFTKEAGEPAINEVVLRGTTTQDKLLYPSIRIEKVVQSNPNTGVVTTYTEGTHFSVATDTITWITGAPSAGTYYSIKYWARFEWIVGYMPPQPRWEAGTDLSPKVVIRQKVAVQKKKQPGT